MRRENIIRIILSILLSVQGNFPSFYGAGVSSFYLAPIPISTAQAARIVEERDWKLYFGNGKGELSVWRSGDIREAPSITFANSEHPQLTELPEWIRRLASQAVVYWTATQELGFKRAKDIEIRKKRKQSTGRIVKLSAMVDERAEEEPEQQKEPKQQFVFKINAVEKLRLFPPTQGKDAIPIPALLFHTSLPDCKLTFLERAREFFGGYGVRQITFPILYEGVEPATLQTLIFLDWIQDFLSMNAAEKKAITKLLKEVISPDQNEIVNLFEALERAEHSNLNEKFIEQTCVLADRSLKGMREPAKAQKIASVSEAWNDHHSADLLVDYFFGRVNADLPKDQQLWYLEMISLQQPELSRPIREFLSFYAKVEEEIESLNEMGQDDEQRPPLKAKLKNQINVDAIQRADRLMEALVRHTFIRQKNLIRIKELVFEAVRELGIQLDPEDERFPPYFYFQRSLQAIVESNAGLEPHRQVSISECTIQYWVDLSLKHASGLLGGAKGKSDLDTRLESLRKAKKFVLSFHAAFNDITRRGKNVLYHYTVPERIEEIRSRIDAELKCVQEEMERIQSKTPPEAEETEQDIRDRVIEVLKEEVERKEERAKIVDQSLQTTEFNFELVYNVITAQNDLDLQKLKRCLKEEEETDENAALTELVRSRFRILLEQFETMARNILDPSSQQSDGFPLDFESFYRLARFFEARLTQGLPIPIQDEDLKRHLVALSAGGKDFAQVLAALKQSAWEALDAPSQEKLTTDKSLTSLFKFTLEDAIDIPFRKWTSGVIASAVAGKITFQGTPISFNKNEYYQMLVTIRQAYSRRLFSETPLHDFLKKKIVDAEIKVPAFQLAFERIQQKPCAPEVQITVEPDASPERLFELYVDCLIFEQGLGLEPEIKLTIREKLKSQISSQLDPGSSEALFASAVLQALDQNYQEASEDLAHLLEQIVRQFKEEKGKHEREMKKPKTGLVRGIWNTLTGAQPVEVTLTPEQQYASWNDFYNRPDIVKMRGMFKSSYGMLKHILAENKTHRHRLMDQEELSFEQIERLNRLLEKRKINRFLKDQLPRITKLPVGEDTVEVRVYDFLEREQEAGKESLYELQRYRFYGTPIYDFLGYYILEIPKRDNAGNFEMKRYVSKVALNEFTTSLYAERLVEIENKKEQLERFKNNHLKEKLVNTFVAEFKRFLQAEARDTEDPDIQEYANLLDVPEIKLSGNIEPAQNPEKEVNLLLIEFLPDLETEVPKFKFSGRAAPLKKITTMEQKPKEEDREKSPPILQDGPVGLLSEVEENARSVQWHLLLLQGKIFQEVEKADQKSDRKPKELWQITKARFNKLKALSVVLSVVLRDTDKQNFFSGTRLALIDTEGCWTPAYSSLFDVHLADGAKSFDPEQPLSTHQAWRLNNVMVSEHDDVAIYRAVVKLMRKFLWAHPHLTALPGLPQEEIEKIEALLKKMAGTVQEEGTLMEDVKKLVESDGTTYLNKRGDVLSRKKLEDEARAQFDAKEEEAEAARMMAEMVEIEKARLAQLPDQQAEFSGAVAVAKPPKGRQGGVIQIIKKPQPPGSEAPKMRPPSGRWQRPLPRAAKQDPCRLPTEDFKNWLAGMIKVDVGPEVLPELKRIMNEVAEKGGTGLAYLYGVKDPENDNRHRITKVIPHDEMHTYATRKSVAGAKSNGLIYLGRCHFKLNDSERIKFDPKSESSKLRDVVTEPYVSKLKEEQRTTFLLVICQKNSKSPEQPSPEQPMKWGVYAVGIRPAHPPCSVYLGKESIFFPTATSEINPAQEGAIATSL